MRGVKGGGDSVLSQREGCPSRERKPPDGEGEGEEGAGWKQDLSPHFPDVIVKVFSSLRGAFFAGFARGMEATGRCLRSASPHHVLEVGMVCHRAWVRHGLKVTISFFSTCAVSSLGRMDGLVMS